MEDVLDVYKQPYNADYPVICMDESSKQLVKETRVRLRTKEGVVERYDSEYERNGTANIFMGFEPLSGKRFVKITERRTKADWALYIKELIDSKYAEAKKVILVMDNLNTHHCSSFYEAFSPQEARRLCEKIEIHYTPKHGSWLNVAEIELSHLSRQCLNRRIPDRETLKTEVASWSKDRNQRRCKVSWQFTTENARIKLKTLYPKIGQNL